MWNRQTWIFALCLVALPSTSAQGARVLKEPVEIQSFAKKKGKRSLLQLTRALEIEDQCPLPTLRSPEFAGVACRLALFSHAHKMRKLHRVRDIDRLLQALRIALRSAGDLIRYAPLNPPPELENYQFLGHQNASSFIMNSYDALKRKASSRPSKAQKYAAELISDQGRILFRAACETTRDSVYLAGQARVSIESQASLQRMLTSHQCFLDESKLMVEKEKARRGPDSSSNPPPAKRSAEALLSDFANTRLIDIKRCQEKYYLLGRAADRQRIQECSCKQMKRWKFPKEKGRPLTRIRIEVIQNQYWMNVSVSALGRVETCSALKGKR